MEHLHRRASSADLTGSVTDPNGAVIPGATVTIENPATGFTRTLTTNDSGEYQAIGIPPGVYSVSASAATFKTVKISNVKLTVGQRASLTIPLDIGATDNVVDIDISSVELIETTKSTVASTIEQEKIENLPINERSATGFALTLSTVGRDNGRPIGHRHLLPGSTLVDSVGVRHLFRLTVLTLLTTRVNAARSTVSQEAVQEYQVADKLLRSRIRTCYWRKSLTSRLQSAEPMISTEIYLVLFAISVFKQTIHLLQSITQIFAEPNGAEQSVVQSYEIRHTSLLLMKEEIVMNLGSLRQI